MRWFFREQLALLKSVFVLGPVATYKLRRASFDARKQGLRIYLADVRRNGESKSE